jgi:hypothetical protein
MFLRPLILATVLLVATVQSGSALADPRPGIGPSTERPVGRPVDLPPGLVIDHLASHDGNECRRRPGEREQEVRGVGIHVRLCIAFRNTTSAPIRFDLPPGAMFVSFDDEVQNGLLITVETFEVDPDDMPYYVALNLWCANADRSPAGGGGQGFELGPVTEDDRILAMIRSLAGREITREAWGMVQAVVWNATDGKELSSAERAWLETGRLPSE